MFYFFIQTAQSRLKNVGRGKLSSEFFWILMLILKLVNYSCSQKPINDDYLDQVDESWYLMKHQIKHCRVFLWDETCFSSQMKRSQGCLSRSKRENPHNGVVQRENMSLHNFLLFHLRRYGLRPRVFVCFSVSGTPWWRTRPPLLTPKDEEGIWNSFFHFACLTSLKLTFNIMSKFILAISSPMRMMCRIFSS